ncbi:MAG: Polyketide cyclase / dehydrase and lipid transport [Chloroflexi bacterium OLB14]|nr:MAG: Polyketide cyclase / dehydrase and lipid transport [Chloroflexi bacterium OLB14]
MFDLQHETSIIIRMKQGTFEKEIFIQSDVATVINTIADYSQHHKIHPLIVNVERAKDAPEGVRRYFITDSLQWGPFRFKIKYRADILSVTTDTVHTEAYQFPSTYIVNVTTVTPTDNGVRLHETFSMKAPNLLFGYAFQQAQAAHGEMLQRIKKFIESNGNLNS